MGSPLNILLVVHHFPPRHLAGAELRAFRIARWLIARDHRVRVLCIDRIDDTSAGAGMNVADETHEGVPVRRLSFDLAAAPDPLKWSYDNPLLGVQMDEAISAERPDLISLISGYLFGLAPLAAARRHAVPIVVTLTDFWFLCPTIQLLKGDGTLCYGPEPVECARCLYDQQRRFRIPDRVAPALMRAFLRSADRLPLIGDALGIGERLHTLADRRDRLRSALNGADAIISLTRSMTELSVANGIDRHRVTIVQPSIVEAEWLDTFDRPSADPATVLRIGYLGQVAPIKGVEVLIRAFTRLDRSRRRARLRIHGGWSGHDGYGRRIEKLAADDPDITLAGRYERPELPRIMNDLDVVVVPSIWHENAPGVIHESLAAGRPVVGSRVGGIAEVLEDEVNGLLFERENPADLARQLQRLLDDPGLLGRLSAAIQPVRTEDTEMRQLFSVYRSVADAEHLRVRRDEHRVDP